MGMGREGPRLYKVTKMVADALPTNAAKRLEQRIRERKFERTTNSELNDLLYYNVQEKYPDEVAIHVHVMLTKSPMEMHRLAIDGLEKLATTLENNPDLSHIKWVAGFSWIVRNNPRLAKKLGFEVSEDEPSLARMTRADFISRFGTKK